jgi:plastocyanin
VNAGTRQSRVHDVSVNGFAFVPKVLEVHAGDIVRWTNHDLAPHTATADGRGWNTEEITQGQSAEIAVTAHMETTYFCLFHPHMKGRLIIVEI